MAGQVVQQAVEQSVLRVAKQLEEQLDSELHKLDNLQDDDLERLRQRRIQDLKQQQEKAKEWMAKGHGEYREIFDEKEFFREMKGEDRMVCHFFRNNWPCKVRPALFTERDRRVPHSVIEAGLFVCLHAPPLDHLCVWQHECFCSSNM